MIVSLSERLSLLIKLGECPFPFDAKEVTTEGGLYLRRHLVAFRVLPPFSLDVFDGLRVSDSTEVTSDRCLDFDHLAQVSVLGQSVK